MVLALEETARAIAHLDGRICASFVRRPWVIRAAWSGFAEAMRLQGAEIDDIDVYSWGCGVPLPHRARRTSHLDEFAGFERWAAGLGRSRAGEWRDALPVLPAPSPDQPILLRALAMVRQHALHADGMEPWLHVPAILQGLGFTRAVLPCVVAGAKSFRDRRGTRDDGTLAALRMMGAGARRGLALLDGLERDHRTAARAIRDARRPGALTALAALSLVRPLLSPVAVAEALNLSLSGAGKLLDRAARLGLLREISGRSTWKAYLPPDLAIAFGLAPAPRGRPRHVEPLAPADRDLAAVLAEFDREMAAFDQRFPTVDDVDEA